MMGRLLGEDVELCTEFDPELPRTLTDRGQMEQVLLNLAVNARDAMPHGGTLVIRTRHVRPDDVAALGRDLAPRSYALLSVRDTGTGMPPEVAEQIFEPFFTTKPLGEGTGLGLSTVYGIVRQTEGDIWVDTTPGQGSTFTVVLPASDGVDQPAATMAAPAVSSGGSETILLVEDEDTVRRLARRLLTSRGYNVV
jgi:two-component system cell cycle sensor histidine kinase/response regulator CckA